MRISDWSSDVCSSDLIAPPEHADAERLAHPVRKPGVRSSPLRDGFRAYSASKLCNLLTARALSRSQAAEVKHLRIIAYNPGFTLGTGLQRSAPLILWLLIGMLRPIVVPLFRTNKPVHAAQVLADLRPEARR